MLTQEQKLGGRRQLEIVHSPREYLQTLQLQAYQGETRKQRYVTTALK